MAPYSKRKTYTAEQKQIAIELRKQGMTIPAISKKLDCTTSILEKWFRLEKITLTQEQSKINIVGARWKNYDPVVDGTKKCSKCNETKKIHEFYKDVRAKHGISGRCMSCDRQYYAKNTTLYKERSKKWKKDNAAHVKYLKSMERSSKIQATPKWLTDDQKKEIRQIYSSCPKGYQVDHIIPLNGEIVCGLHVPWNLQHLPKSKNTSKGNRIKIDIRLNIGTCHQYKRREETLKEDISNGMPINLDVKDFIFSHEQMSSEHSSFIKRYEWLGTTGFNGPKHVFVARYNGVLGGIVIISEPSAYSSFGKDLECLIQRGACASWTPKCLGSSLVMFSCRWMTQNTTKRLFTAYSDPEAGEIGTIYQACNFDYLGDNYGANFLYQLSEGRWVNSRYFTRTSSMKKWAKILGIEWQSSWCKPNGYQDVKAIPKEILKNLRDYGKNLKYSLQKKIVLSKGKYCLLLGKDRREQKELNKLKTWIGLPYPKRSK